MGMLRIMSRRGDDRVTWDAARAATGDAEAIAAIAEAERIFREHRAKGATAFAVEQGHAPVRIDAFDSTAEHIMLVPRIVGG